MPDEFLSPREVVDQYPVFGTAQALAERRWRGDGPAYIKTGKGRSGRVFYSRATIERFLDDCTVTPRSAA
ncbi:DNA-binding protein [Streptomyces sp. NPDC102467]|uniref:DNA-binding protein n=1 Tax=Streptomyces sp. NPDC102467 TaxID=3366179 RepID=UPI003818029D